MQFLHTHQWEEEIVMVERTTGPVVAGKFRRCAGCGQVHRFVVVWGKPGWWEIVSGTLEENIKLVQDFWRKE